MKKLLLILITFFTITTSFAQLKDSIKAHIDSAINIMQEHSLYASRVKWKQAKQQAYKDAANATTREQAFKAIANVYAQLQDRHGWFEQYTDKIKLTDSSAMKRQTPLLAKEWGKGPKITALMLGDVAYLRMPGMFAFNQKQIDMYANWLADSVVSLAARNPTAWIIDLRLNTGGNIIPMMAGLASFFTDGTLFYYIDRDNVAVEKGSIKDAVFYLNDTSHANVKKGLPGMAAVKVAVIVGPGTGSSGEGVAINFKNRKNSKLFGERTAGFANSTEGFVFNNENSYFLLTTSVIGNKNKKRLPEYVMPHLVIKNNDLFEDINNDNAVKAAKAWLGGNR